jgi:hypothetical protein
MLIHLPMNQRRLRFSVLLGLGLTPVACYLGFATMPSAVTVWLWSLIVALPLAPFFLLGPVVVGGLYALPVTCLAFPAVSAVLISARWWVPFIYMAVGLIAAPLSVVVISSSAGSMVSAASKSDLMMAGTFAGAMTGLIYGYFIWRYDRRLAVAKAIETA